MLRRVGARGFAAQGRRSHVRRAPRQRLAGRSRAALAVALGASLVLHAAVLALLSALPARRQPPRRAAPVEIAIEVLRMPPPALGRPAVAPAPAVRRDRPAKRGGAPGGATRSRGTAHAGPSTGTPSLGGAAARAAIAPGELPFTLSAPVPAPLDLRPRLPLAPEAAGNERAQDAGPVGSNPLEGWFTDETGRRRVEAGLAHPYYDDLGKALVSAWDPERALKARAVIGNIEQYGRNALAFGRAWWEMAGDFGRSGAPGVIDGGSERMKELVALPGGPAQAALVQAEVGRQVRRALSKGAVTTVRVTQDAEGRLLSAELVSSSENAAIDRMALADVRAAAGRLPVPPQEVAARRARLVSLWEFELEISISPPIPVVAIEFDEVLGLKDVRLPLDRRVWKKVRLVAVQ